ncbi:hypothetical protein [Salipiger abyssi]|uniref:Uncharacterized protein n=1 Tax=Salipiger abyssi TaxID=1250539 RepID=A0A1P8UUH5_9RHOB|nr:hypothetical protein [Salipiger abyssi]APZ53035.1 hypothetical protein Ga0080574_TMP2701 [Salipiger abyssi]
MSRRFIAAVLSASLAVTAFAAAPARADEKDLARLIGTAATLAVIGSAISQASNGNDSNAVRVHQTWPPRSNGYPPAAWHRDREDRWQGHRTAPSRQNHGRNLLPGQCVQNVNLGRVRQIVSKHCLKQNGIKANRLPERCEIEFRIRGEKRKAYMAQCLSKAGYDFGHRRHGGDRFGGRDDRHRYRD